MSFGEHLEELRKVLVRALIGVAIACIFGFMFANQTIQILKQPLVDAIEEYNIDDANTELEERYGYVPPEYTTWMNEGHIPRQVQFEPEQIVRAIQSAIPNFGAVVDLEPYGFRADRFKQAQLPNSARDSRRKRDTIWRRLRN